MGRSDDQKAGNWGAVPGNGGGYTSAGFWLSQSPNIFPELSLPQPCPPNSLTLQLHPWEQLDPKGAATGAAPVLASATGTSCWRLELGTESGSQGRGVCHSVRGQLARTEMASLRACETMQHRRRDACSGRTMHTMGNLPRNSR